MKNIIRRYTLVELLIVIAILCILLSCFFPTGIFVPESKAIKALQTQGFNKIKIVDRDVWFVRFKGGDRDAVRFTATATNPAGKEVTVYVFSGWLFKGATIRTP